MQSRTPGQVYAAVKKMPDDFVKKIQPMEVVEVTLSTDDVDGDMQKLSEHIGKLREQDFDGYYESDGSRVLVKFHDENKNKGFKLNPIHIHEADVQAMRYVRGMLLIAKNSPEVLRAQLMTRINEIYADYIKRKTTLGESADLTHWLTEQFTQCLSNYMHVKPEKASKQLTMARDLGIMLEQHPAVCTISEEADQVTIEQSTPYKVSARYYEDLELFGDIPRQQWFRCAKKAAGFSAEQQDSWLEKFFTDEASLAAWKANRVATPPSSRWLPLPPNNQLVSVVVAERKKEISEMEFSHTEFMRTGVLVAYDVKKILETDSSTHDEQKKIAKKILKELIGSQLAERIRKYKELYGDLIGNNPFNFYVTYQTLLSPIIGEEKGWWKNNNAKFITIVKEVVGELAADPSFQAYGAKVVLAHTNSAVNRNAYLSNEFSADDNVRREKIKEFEKHKHEVLDVVRLPDTTKLRDIRKLLLDAGYKKELVNELIARENACDNMQLLLDGQAPYSKLKKYQRNIMLSALEHLSMGKQVYTVAGCKSARDRTGVFACAVKVMQENPQAMRDWKVLEKGIVKSLKQGHAFRSMIYHSAIVKIDLVHERFMKLLSRKTQNGIKALLKFSQKTPKYKEQQTQASARPVVAKKRAGAISTVKPLPALPAVISISHASSFVEKLGREDSAAKVQSGSEAWQKAKSTFVEELDISSLAQYLAGFREKHLNSKSFVDTNQGVTIRVYPHRKDNLTTSTDDFLALGVDSVRGALTILEHTALLNEKVKAAKEQIIQATKLFYAQIEKQAFKPEDSDEVKLAKLKQAQLEYKKFNGVLANILVEAGCYPKGSAALKGIFEARDFLWVQSRKSEAVCTVRHNDKGKMSALCISKRASFTGDHTSQYENQPWYFEFTAKHPWAGSFLHANPDVLHLSSMPSQRGLPNPASAWDEATILITDGKVGQIISGARMGVSSPFQVKDKKERQRIATQNQFLMANDDRLRAYAEQHIAMWRELLPEGELTIPVLHQTLIDVPLSSLPDRTGENPRDMLMRKHIANQELQRHLDGKEIYYNKQTGQVLIDPDPDDVSPEDHVKIKFALKETNNGIHLREQLAGKPPKDIRDSRSLIDAVIEKLEAFQELTPDPNLQTVIAYLQSSTPSQPRPMTNEEKIAVKELCNKLFHGGYSLDASTQRNLALLIHAATNLTSFLSDNTGASIVEYVRDGVVVLQSKLKADDLNDVIYKSCYERIIAELLGMRIGGCKTGLDREQEVAELTSAMYRRFNAEGVISNYDDLPAAKVAFRDAYVNTQHKHNMCEMAAGSLGAADRETRGQAYHQESAYERGASALFERAGRHPSYVECTLADYQKECRGEHAKPSWAKLFSRSESVVDDSVPQSAPGRLSGGPSSQS